MSETLNPITLIAGQGSNIQLPNPQTIQAVILANKSSYDLIIQGLDQAGPRWHPSGTADLYIAQGTNRGVLSVQAINTANIPNPPPSIALVTVYAVGETIPAGHWPVAIPTQSISASIMTTIANQVINDGTAAGFEIVESTVAGDTNSAVTLTNDAQFTLGDAAHAALMNIIGQLVVSAGFNVTGNSFLAGNLLFPNSNSLQWFDTAAVVRQVLTLSNTNKVILSGMAQFLEMRDQSGIVQFQFDITGNGVILINSTTMNIQTASGFSVINSNNVNTHLNCRSGGTTLQVAGIDVFGVTSTVVSCGQRLLLAGAGGLTSVTHFTGTGTTTGVAHGCKDATGANAAPDNILISCTAPGSTMTTGYSAVTSTTCTITCGTALAWKATAIKF